MAANDVYTPTTVAEPKSSCFLIPGEPLEKIRLLVKLAEVLLSFVAFIVEEVVNSCISCTSLYFFEFISCTAFLFTLLLLVLLYTTLHRRLGVPCWPTVDFVYTAIIGVLFFIASITFAANSHSTLEQIAVAFGFMASLAFAVDLGLFWKHSGVPFLQSKQDPSNATPAGGAAETEKLNTPVNGAE
ncbi:CKLF-like MARVEL transmembrane domain-containing protein 6 [Thalassophryne amazonica]|uniref:CKLF-like MARVEL transmembrane domain-containing protein 6 n=1 Tax=Thalassophryne amazonica TaxID=390379 RepID=UPI001471E571|nr:CKLF-like MARVEL transmembrane domain-containing protein 6 [Thalassophryne amazonica]